VLRHATEISDALAYAHRQGIVHRDLKPGNVMLTKGGAVLLDFGLAKLTSARSSFEATTIPASLTEQGDSVGTVHYMAPEQLEGREVDAKRGPVTTAGGTPAACGRGCAR
jgi:serine/threonine protein kinase